MQYTYKIAYKCKYKYSNLLQKYLFEKYDCSWNKNGFLDIKQERVDLVNKVDNLTDDTILYIYITNKNKMMYNINIFDDLSTKELIDFTIILRKYKMKNL